MKGKITLALLTVLLCMQIVMPVRADIIDAVYTTDIGALIDGNPIKSYNISDSTYIKA